MSLRALGLATPASVDLAPEVQSLVAGLSQAMTAIQAADARAANAQQMVRSRDPKLDQASTEAHDAAAAMAAGAADRQVLHGQVDTLGKRLDRAAIGARSILALLLNGTTTLTIPLSRTQPDTDYAATFAHTTAGAGEAKYTDVVKTTSTVSVKVTANVALSAGIVVVLVS